VSDFPPQTSHANGFLFADLRDYTRFAETRGDQAAAELLSTYRALVRAQIERSAGAEIRTEGDSFYVVFPSASAAIRTGLAILEQARLASEATPDRPIRVGIGVHAGETAETAEGLVGSAVNIAARVCSLAKADELLVTDIVRGLTRTSVPYAFVPIGTRRLKGIAEPIALYRVAAEPGYGARQPARRPTRRAWAGATGIGVALLVGAVILRIVAFGGTGSQPTPLASATDGGATSQAPASADATFPTSAEKDLLSRLPLTVYQDGQTNCVRSVPSQVAPGASVSVTCTVPPGGDADSVTYDQFAGGLQMGTFVDALQNRRHLPQGDCAHSPAAWQLWIVSSVGDGKLLCYPDESHHAWVVWTYSSSFTLARASRVDADWQKLYGWWSLTAPLILR
jgi:class 3 adenylate cyclase